MRRGEFSKELIKNLKEFLATIFGNAENQLVVSDDVEKVAMAEKMSKEEIDALKKASDSVSKAAKNLYSEDYRNKTKFIDNFQKDSTNKDIDDSDYRNKTEPINNFEKKVGYHDKGREDDTEVSR